MRIVFFGTPPFAAKILDHLLRNHAEIVGVVSRPDKPKGRARKLQPTAVKEYLINHHPKVPLFQPEKASSESFASTLKELNPDLFVVVAYGEIIKQNLLDIPKLMPINIHASLLPKYRGAAPIQRALMEGEEESGVTIMEMVLKMDAGDMLHQEKLPLPKEMNFAALEEALCDLSCKAISKVLGQFAKGEVAKVPQNPKEVTYAAKIGPADCQIDWKKPASVIHNQVRGLSPRPGAVTTALVGGVSKRVKILKSQVATYPKTDSLTFPCGQDFLEILELQVEGKRAMSADDFLRGSQKFTLS